MDTQGKALRAVRRSTNQDKMNTKKWIALVLFVLAACVNFTGNYIENELLIRVSKPLLMPLILLNALLALEETAAPRWLGVLLSFALCFHCGGDVFLMFAGPFPLFVAGLACFLIGHIFYVSIFLKTGVFRNCPPVLMFAVFFLSICIPSVLVNVLAFEGPIKYAVLVYAFVLLYVSGCGAVGALNRKSGVSSPVYWLAFIGGLVFITSDFFVAWRSLLGHNFKGIGLLVMSTYVLAECLIVTAIVRPYLKR